MSQFSKDIRVTFVEDPGLDSIEVTVRAPEKDETVEALMGRIAAGKTGPETVLALDGEGNLTPVDLRDSVSVSVADKQIVILTSGNRYTVRQPLQSFEERLKSAVSGRFIRISRYEIVNLDKVRKFDFTLSGTLRLELAGGIETWASRRNIPAIRKKLAERK